MFKAFKRAWDKYTSWRNKHGDIIHTIVFARIKFFLGLSYTVIQQSGIDISAYIVEPKWKIAVQLFFAWLAVDGSLTEWYRRHLADDITVPPVTDNPK